jgi:hypothetical protein
MSAEKELRQLHDDFVAEFRGTTVSARIWERFRGRIISTVLNNPQLKALAIELLTSAFDKVIVPIDIPLVPDELEKEFEDFARAQIPLLVEWALSRVGKTSPNPPAPETPAPGFGF